MLLACLHERLGIWYCILSASRLRAILLALKLLVFLYVRSFKFLFSNFWLILDLLLDFCYIQEPLFVSSCAWLLYANSTLGSRSDQFLGYNQHNTWDTAPISSLYILSAHLFVDDMLLTLLILFPIVYTSFRRFQLSTVFLYLRWFVVAIHVENKLHHLIVAPYLQIKNWISMGMKYASFNELVNNNTDSIATFDLGN